MWLGLPAFPSGPCILRFQRASGARIRTAAATRTVDAALAGLDGGQKERDMKMEDLFQGFDPSAVRRRCTASVGQVKSVRPIGTADQALHA